MPLDAAILAAAAIAGLFFRIINRISVLSRKTSDFALFVTVQRAGTRDPSYVGKRMKNIPQAAIIAASIALATVSTSYGDPPETDEAMVLARLKKVPGLRVFRDKGDNTKTVGFVGQAKRLDAVPTYIGTTSRCPRLLGGLWRDRCKHRTCQSLADAATTRDFSFTHYGQGTSGARRPEPQRAETGRHRYYRRWASALVATFPASPFATPFRCNFGQRPEVPGTVNKTGDLRPFIHTHNRRRA